MIRTLAAAAMLVAAVLTGCQKETPPLVIVKTIHPDGTATCVLKQEGAGEQQLGGCPTEGHPKGWITETVTAPPTP